MEVHWWCCECNTTNSSPDDEHLVCSEESCDHHLCGNCYNPQQIGRDGHLNDHVVTTRTTISRAVVNDARYEEHKARHNFRAARRLIGHHVKHSQIGRSFLNFWRSIQRRRKKEKLRIEGKYMPTVIIPSNTETAPSTSHYYEPEENIQYAEEKYHYET